MSSGPSLLVPMNVAGLCISQQDQTSGLKFGKIADEFQNLETKPYLGTSVVPVPFEEEAAPAGIHLHWALPEALTRSDPSNGQGFRQAPNRFLVVRLAAILPKPGEAAAVLEKQAWVVESDYLWKDDEKGKREGDPRNALSRAVPVDDAIEKSGLTSKNIFVHQGRVRALDGDWVDSKSHSQRRFTALGYGTETYAAAYPNCRNVFGFFDPLFHAVHAPDGLDLKHRHLSYLVIGWYSELAWDPITQVKNSETYRKILSDSSKKTEIRESRVNVEHLAVAETFTADYRWSYNLYDDAKKSKQPAQTLFVGQLNALEWKPDQASAAPQADPVAVALGNTTAEALSALLASTTGPGYSATIETLLNDIQSDLLRDYATASGQASRLDALHDNDFAPVPAGHASGTSGWLFAKDDFKDVQFFLKRLKEDRNKKSWLVSQFVWEQVRQSPLFHPNAPMQQQESVLIPVLNAMLMRVPIHEPERFKDVTLRPETRLLMAQSPASGDLLIRLNRMLLEDTYPDEIDAVQGDSGRIWLIQPAGSAKRGEPAAIGLPLPEDLGTALAALNRSQAVFDDRTAAVATRRGQVFADWTKYLAAKDADNGADTQTYIQQEIVELNNLIQKLKDERMERDQAKGVLKRLLRLPHNTRTPRNGLVPPVYEYELDSAAAPRFYQPNDPVVLISGLKSTRYGGGRSALEGQGNLKCRLSDEVTTAGNLAGMAADKRALLNACAGAGWDSILTSALPCRSHLISLCIEACLLHRSMGDLIGSADLAQRQDGYVLHGNTDSFKGAAPSPAGLANHAQPWIPMVLQWETTFSPFQPLCGPNQTQTDYSEMWGLQNFELAGLSPEIEYTGANPGFSGPGTTTYRGTVTLAHQVQAKLNHQIDNYLQDHPLVPDKDPPAVQQLKRTLEEIARLPLQVVAQSMSGFHGQLRMRNQTLQMQVVAPPPPGIRSNRALKDKYVQYLQNSKFALEVGQAVGGESDASCLEDRRHFNPLRAGILKFSRLRVVDAFGQVRDLIAPNPHDGLIQPGEVILSARLNKAPRDWNETGAVLPLRIAQPARLSFRYSPAASSPIFGWVLFNRFDHALAIYDEEGRPVGSFNLLGPAWQETPGANRGVLNPQLLEFVAHLGGKVPASPQDPGNAPFREMLGKLIDTIDDAVAGIEPDSFRQDQGLAVLIGRPLALVTADLRLDLYGSMPGEDSLPGLPAIDQSREALDVVKSASRYVEKNRWSAEFAKVRFPLQLGDDGKVHDGLVGYFVKGQDAAATYRIFFSHSAAPGGSDRVVAPPLDGAEGLSLAPADPLPKSVVMLVDPRAAVHANVGILPVKRIALPPAMYAEALKRIDATFLVAPILGGADSVALPVPTEVGHAWSWLTRHGDEELFRKSGVGVRKWITQPLVVSPNPRAAFSAPPLRMSEGWLHLYPVETSPDAGGEKKPASAPTPYDILVKADISGRLMLGPETATLHGERIAMAETDDGKRFIGYWNDRADYVSWKTKLAVGTWDVYVNKRQLGLDAADRVDAQIEVEVRSASKANVVSHQVEFPRGQQRLLAGDFATAHRDEYEVRIKLLRGTINLESVDLVPRR